VSIAEWDFLQRGNQKSYRSKTEGAPIRAP